MWQNPYVAGNPIRGTEIFFGREDVFEWLRRHLHGRFQDKALVLYGERRTGKTSVLYQLPRRLNDAGYIPLFIDAQQLALDSIKVFLWQFAVQIWESIRRLDGAEQLAQPQPEDFAQAPQLYFTQTFLTQIREVIEPRRLLLLFDEFGCLPGQAKTGKLLIEVFHYLRSLLADHRLTLVFSIAAKLEEMGQDYAPLFDQALYHQITFLTQADARALITKPAAPYYSYLDEAVDLILQATSGHPAYIQHICHTIFAQRDQGDSRPVSRAEVAQALSQVAEATATHLKLVWDSASPMDQVVLAAMATLITRVGGDISLVAIRQLLINQDVCPPPGLIAAALQTLGARDVIVDGLAGKFKFALEPLRLWLSNERPLDLVRRHLAASGVLARWQAETRPVPHRRRLRRPLVVGLTALVAVFLTGGLWIAFGASSVRRSDDRDSLTVAAGLVSPAQITNSPTPLPLPTETAVPTSSPTSPATVEPVRAKVEAGTATVETVLVEVETETATAVTQADPSTPTATPTETVVPTAGPTSPATVEPTQAEVATQTTTAVRQAGPNAPTATSTAGPTATAGPTQTPPATPVPTSMPTPALSLADLRGKILFITNRTGNPVEIYQMNPDGSDQRSLGQAGFTLYQHALGREPLSSAGQEIIEVRGPDQTELWRFNLVNGTELRVTSNPANDYDPAWSPINNDLLFVSERSGRTDIYRLNLDLPGDVGERLTLTDDFDKHPSWSPDATRIVYWSGDDQRRQIWLLDLASQQTVNISNSPFNDWDPVWIK